MSSQSGMLRGGADGKIVYQTNNLYHSNLSWVELELINKQIQENAENLSTIG